MWETIIKEQGQESHRLKVPGGWIVKSIIVHYRGCSVSQIFVEDKKHQWNLTK